MSDDKRIQKYINTIDNNYYRNLSEDELIEIQNKVDNFLELAYLSPETIDNNTLDILKSRENKLKTIKLSYQILGALTFSIPYIIYRQKMGFYFRNFCWTVVGSLVFGYFIGNKGQYYYNRKNYKLMIMKLALNYNISDEEIEVLHEILKKNNKIPKI